MQTNDVEIRRLGPDDDGLYRDIGLEALKHGSRRHHEIHVALDFQ